MIWPGVQKPHWKASCSMKACCIGCRWAGSPSPSIVVTSLPAALTARTRQAFTLRSSRCTVQAPHSPWLHPFLVPVSPRRSRNASSRVTRGSSARVRSTPFTRSVTGTTPRNCRRETEDASLIGSIGVSFTGHRRAVRQYLHGPIVEADILPGASFVTSSSDLRWLKVREPSESLEVYPRPGLVRAVAAELDGSRAPALPDVGGVEDPVVW